MKVLILAAGYGTRLYPLVVNTPKSLLAVKDRPLVDYSLDKVRQAKDLNEILVVTNDKFYQHFCDWAKKLSDFPVPIKVVNDGTKTPDDRLGSVGDIDFTINQEKIQDDLLVIGGDNLFDDDFGKFFAFAAEKKPSVTIGVYDIHNKEEATKFGVVDIDKCGKIISFEEKPAEPKSSLIAMCVYYFPKETVGLVAEYLKESQKADKAGDYIRWLSQKHGVYAYQFQGAWYDIGSIESYHEAQAKFKE